MRLLANENIPLVVIEALCERGHDVLWMCTESPGAPDTDVLVNASTALTSQDLIF